MKYKNVILSPLNELRPGNDGDEIDVVAIYKVKYNAETESWDFMIAKDEDVIFDYFISQCQ